MQNGSHISWCGSAKPTFFQDGNRSPLFEVDISTGMLQNTDRGTPVAQIGGIGLNTPILPQRAVKQACRVFQASSTETWLSFVHGCMVLFGPQAIQIIGNDFARACCFSHWIATGDAST
jgi:hypothetical protein